MNGLKLSQARHAGFLNCDGRCRDGECPVIDPQEWTCPRCGERDLPYMAASHECFDDRRAREAATVGVQGSLL